MQCIESMPILNGSDGTPIGLIFSNGAWYKYSSHLNAWCRCNDLAAMACVITIAAAINALPFAVEFANSDCSRGGKHAVH